MSNPGIRVTYPKQPWYDNALRTGRAILGRALSQTGSGIARGINYAGQGIVQAAELGANAFPWYRKLPTQDKLGPWYTKNVFTPNDKLINLAESNDKSNFSYPEDMSNNTKQILDHTVVTPLDMLGSYATGSWFSKVPAVVNYGSRYADKVYPMLRKAVGYTLGNEADVLAYGGQAVDGMNKAVNQYLDEQ